MLFGISGKSSAPVDETTYLSSMSRRPAGSVLGSLPVAIMVLFALIC